MNCPTCGFENRDDASFCGECGTPCAREDSCSRCGRLNPRGRKFCDGCGASLARARNSNVETRNPDAPSRRADAADQVEARKVVTIVFADLIGSTSLHERLDAESARRLMDRYYGALRTAVEAHGGTVVKLMGDGVMAAFGVPRVAEDDAIRAVRAGVAMQQAFRTLADEQAATVGHLGLRIGVNTGEVIVSADNTDVVGDPVNVAARLQQEAQDGEVVIGEPTRRLVSELVTLAAAGVFALKGRAETVATYRVVSLDRPAAAAATAFVGRDDELRRVMTVYDAAVAERRVRLAVVLGSPGLGKSRLLDEVARRLSDAATVLTAQCDAAGEATFAPLAAALRELLRSDTPPEVPGVGAVREPPETTRRIGTAAWGDSRIAPTSGDQQPQRGEPQRGGQPIARGSAPGGGGAAEDLRVALEATVPGADAERVRIVDGIAALLAGSPGSPEETFFVVRRFLTALTTTRPVLLAIDDLQWAEPLLLDLVEHLVQWGSGVPLLVLAAARPELRDARSSLATPGRLVSEVVTLAGLDAAAATRLAANVIGADALPAAVAGRVLATSEGNPLFVAELVRMLVNDGALKQEGDRWTTAVDLAALDMPPTIHALLAARIERLRPEDRAVLERAAVVGRQFSRSAVAHLLPHESSDLDARLEALRRSELIEPDTTWFLGEPALRFHHGLTRDAAYRRVLKGTRAELHARCAEWIGTKVGDAIEHDETLGWHLEQAHQHLRELGPIDAHGRDLGERAARYLAAAGRRALARDDLLPAANLLGRALDRLDAADPARADLAIDWCEALLAAGDVAHARPAVDELGRMVGETPSAPSPTHLLSVGEGGGEGTSVGDASVAPSPSGTLTLPSPALNKRAGEASVRLRAWHTCFTGQLAVLTDPQSLHATSDAVAAAADELAAAGDAAGEAKGHFVHATALARLGKVGACEAALDRALAAARRAHDRRRANAVLAVAPLAALWGPSPVTRASGRCLDVVRVLRITQGAPAVEAVALRCQAVLEALRGRTEAARRMIASSRRMVEDLGITQGLLETEMFAGLVELIEGDTAAAEHSLRAAYDGLRAHGLGIDAARAAALLGRTLLAQGRAAEAEALSHESEALAGDDLQAAITWRRVRAEALARRGEHAAAVDFARAAVDIAAATDAMLLHADARLALAAALRAAGRGDEAAPEEARAIELWEAKGATVLAERARESTPARHARNLQAGIQEGGVGARLVTVGMTDESPSLSRLGKERKEDASQLPAPSIRRRVRPNAATATVARIEAAVAARDAEALTARYADGAQHIDHPNGAVYDQPGFLDTIQGMWSASDLTYRHEPLASLGESLALTRVFLSASATVRGEFDIAGFEAERIGLDETDAQGRVCRDEVFAPDRLSDAVVRLYERYAELLPDGPEYDRAAATARSVAAMLAPPDVDRWGAALAPTAEYVDHRTLGFPPARGAKAFLRAVRAMLELAENHTTRIDDMLDLRSDALLVHRTTFGTVRASGGTYEKSFIDILIFGADGLVLRWEEFDVDRDAEALARFDELVGSTSDVPPLGKGRTTEESIARRVRPNAATANLARTDTAFVARDADALANLLSDEVVDHTTGVTYDRQGALATLGFLLRARDPGYRHEPLATLGDWLALCRELTSAGGFAGANFDVGVYEKEQICVVEVDAEGKRVWSEQFANDRLGDAVGRLYERYADLLPEGPERTRAAATARSVAILLGSFDPDRFGTAYASAFEFVDHRILGFGSGHGAEVFLRGTRVLVEVADDIVTRIDDVLDLRSDAFLVRWTNTGTDRASGGAYEIQSLQIRVFGADGLLTRVELFDADRDAEAFARFDELVGSTIYVPPLGKGRTKEESPALTARRVRPNAATAEVARFEAVMAARDVDAITAHIADGGTVVDHNTGAIYERPSQLATWLSLVRAKDGTYRTELLASLGDSLALYRSRASASALAAGKFDVGAYEIETVNVIEVDARGRHLRADMFGGDRLRDAVARLYEFYAEILPDGLSAEGSDPQAGPEHDRAAATARSVAVLLGPFDLERWATAFAPAIEYVDHRTLGLGSAHGAEPVLQVLGSLLEVADGVANRVDDILGLRTGGLLAEWTNFGTDRAGGGAYERHFLWLGVFGADGLSTRIELFDADREAEALARFDELTAEPAPALPAHRRVRANAATANAAHFDAAIAARDADAFPALLADRVETVHHPSGTTFGREGLLATWRSLLRARDPTCRHEPLATLGDSLALCRQLLSARGFEGSTFDVGPYEREDIEVLEADAQGRHRRYEVFAPDRLGDAVVRLYQRYADLLPDGPERVRAAAAARSVATLLGPFEPDRWPTAFAPTITAVDHRTVGYGVLRGAEEFMGAVRALLALSEDVSWRLDDVLGLCDDVALVRLTNVGIDRVGGGTFERGTCVLLVFGADGLVTRWEQFEADREDEALARFDEVTGEAWEESAEPLASRPLRRGSGQASRRRQEKAAPFDGAQDRPQGERKGDSESNDSQTVRAEALEARPEHRRRARSSGLSTHPGAAAEPHGRRVRANAASAHAARLDAVIAARDADALPTLLADDVEVVHHPTGAEHGREGVLFSFRALIEDQDPTLLHEPLATLGDSLGLFHMSWSASGAVRGTLDIGPYQMDAIILIEADPHGRRRRSEVFAVERLGDAVVRLYERYADLLPDGPERVRATVTARSVAIVTPFDHDRLATAWAPAIESIDHRTLGTWSARGAEALLRHFRSLREVADDITVCEYDVLSLQPDAFLVGRIHSGTDRVGGGTYERQFLMLCVFGTDGLLTRIEWFDTERDAEAFARFDELTGEASAESVESLASRPLRPGSGQASRRRQGKAAPFDGAQGRPQGERKGDSESNDSQTVRAEALEARPEPGRRARSSTHARTTKSLRRRVRPNAATANAARFDAAFAARDAEAITAHVALGEDIQHDTGAIYESRAMLPTWLSLMRAQDGTYGTEPLATLGDSLALSRAWASASGIAGGKFDVGAYEVEHILLIEVDAQGQHRRAEIFALNRLGDAIIRLYERYADLLPDGPACTRAAATARSVAAWLGPVDLDRLTTAYAPGIESVDHRTLGTWSARGAEALLQHYRALLDLADGVAMREDDILDLRSDALLVRRTHLGTDRAGGGAYERQFLLLSVFGPDGLMTRNEMFDSDREAEALARFDELTTESRGVRFENAATRWTDRFLAAWEARNWEGVVAGFAAGLRVIDRRKMVRIELDREQHLETLRLMFEMHSSGLTVSVLATRGDRLALQRQVFETSDRNVGPSEVEFLQVSEVDDRGDRVALVVFDPDDLDAAYAELDARFDAGEGAASGTQLKMLARDFAARDWDALAARLAPDLVVYDHRPLGWDTLRSPQAYIEMLKVLVDLAPDARTRADHVRVCERGDLAATTLLGTRDGGAFEDPRVVVAEGDDLGRIRRIDFYTLEQFDEARTRFEELRPDSLHIPPNAASRAGDRNQEALGARDWEAVTLACAPTMTFDDRRRSALLTGDRDMFIASSRVMASVGARMSRTVLATAGDRLSLEHHRWTGATEAGTPSSASLGGAHELSTGFEAEFLSLREVDAEGRIVAIIAFDPEDRRAAIAEAQARFVAGEAASIGGQAPIAVLLRAFAQHDWEALRGCLADDAVLHDRRTLGIIGTLGRDEWIESWRVLADLAPDVDYEWFRILAWNRHGRVAVARMFGTRQDGGPFENVVVAVALTDGDRIQRYEFFDVADADQAIARFDELCVNRAQAPSDQRSPRTHA